MKILKGLCVFIFIVCSHIGFSQQLLLGKNPYAMNKSAVLELNSDEQGLLLPRITDTALINALAPPDGMVIFFVPTKQILLRTNGFWKGLAAVGNYITALTGDVTAAGPGSVAATISNGAVTYAKMQNVSANNKLLGRASAGAGNVEEITLGTGLSLSGSTLNVSSVPNSALANSTITFATGATGTDFNISGSPVALGGTVTLNIPSASATNRGLLTKTDWATFNNKLDKTTADGLYSPLGHTHTFTWTAGGDISGTASGTALLSPSLTVNGLKGAALPALSSGFLKYNGTSWFFDNNTYLTATSSTLQTVTTAGNTSDVGVVLSENGNSPSNSFALKLLRANDNNPQGYLIKGQNSAGNTNLFTVDAWGNVAANSFTKSGGTSSQFLKADGSVDNNTYLTGNQTITLSGDVTGSGTNAITTSIGNNKITDAMLRQSAATSVIGRSAATTGNVADISATADGQYLVRRGGVLTFGTIQSGDVPTLNQNTTGSAASVSGTNVITNTNLRKSAGLSVIGNAGTATANIADITGTTDQVLRVASNGLSLGFGTVATGGIANSAVTYSKIQNVSANNKLLGRATAGAGVVEEITIGSGLSLSGTTLSVSANSWNTTGNAGTTPTTNFIGTTDNQSLVIKTNNTESVRVDNTGNVGVGTTTPSAKLDVSGSVKLGANGSVLNNIVTTEYSFIVGASVPAATGMDIMGVLSFTPGSTDVTITVPTLNSTRGTVSISFDTDLPASVSVAWARVISTTQVKVRFLNSSTSLQMIPLGTKAYITVIDF